MSYTPRTANKLRLTRPDGKPRWLVYGIRRIDTGRMVYIGLTARPLWARWADHCHVAGSASRASAGMRLVQAIQAETPAPFLPEELASCMSLRDAEWVEGRLIAAHDTLFPKGFNATTDLEGGGMSAALRAKRSATQKRAWSTPEARARRSAIAKKIWSDPEQKKNRAAHLKAMSILGRAAYQRAWKDPDRRPALMAKMRKAVRASVDARRNAQIKDPRQDDMI